jgi:hypothetical protein
MAQTAADIRDANRKNLTSLVMTKYLGGDLDDAITSSQASMDPEDVEIVMNKIELRMREKANKQHTLPPT